MKKLLRILHLEDNPNDAELIAEKLMEEDYDLQITRVDNKGDFTHELANKIFDLILADRTTPTFDGISALKLSTELSPETPFIFVSGTLDEEMAIDTLKNGARDYVLKHRLSRLVPAVSRALSEIDSEKKQHLLEKQLREAQKMEELGRLAGGIAHDFNNILAIIQCNNSFLRSTDLSEEEKGRIVETIKEAVDRGAALINQLLTFAKKSESSSSSIQLNPMIESLVNMLRSMFPKNITFEKNLSPDLPILVGDSSQIHQVLLNLCINARDAMPDGGLLIINTSVISRKDILTSHPHAQNQDHIEISISDTGSGMDEETRRHIFDPFFTTKESGKGTGLGLAVVYGVVQSHHGLIDVESQKNRGTTFSLYFPIYTSQENSSGIQNDPPCHDASRKGTETILIVEDEPHLAKMIQRILSEYGYTTFLASDGLEALRTFAQNHEKIDLVLSDSGLPRLSGLQMFLKLKDMRPDIKLVLTSGFLEPQEKAHMLKAGIRHFVLKPFNTDTLLIRIREALNNKSQGSLSSC